jgi:hypothetical protein
MNVHAQVSVDDTSLHKAAVAVCDCLTKSNLNDKATEEQLQQAFLTCMLSSAPDLITQIVASGEDYEKAGQEIGTKLSMEMLKTGCPAFTKIATSMALENGNGLTVETVKPAVLQSEEGIVTKVEEKDFTYITIKSEAGRELTFIYYSYVPGSDDWIKDAANKLKNKKVTVSYINSEVYQPKFKEFMSIRELKSLAIK